ncbi:hypothetical protein C0J52_27358 [Blattella germanica]|nr:hypothetical protein C0J52_27358 [Blattella germanica]
MLLYFIKLKIYKTVILPVILYGLFENKVLRKMFGPKRDEETREWRRLHNMELKDLYGKPEVIRKIKSHRLRWAGHVARMGDERDENNINQDLREIDKVFAGHI